VAARGNLAETEEVDLRLSRRQLLLTLAAVARPARADTFVERIEERAFKLTNDERERAGITELREDRVLTQIARQHSADMLARDFFAHQTPEGQSTGERVALQHRTLVGLTGENIWRASGNGLPTDADELGEMAVRSWMNSPGHRENVLRPSFTHLGLGIWMKGTEIRATQLFADVQGYLQEPVPPKLNRTLRMRFNVKPTVKGGSTPDRFELWPGGKQRPFGPYPVYNAFVDAPPGRYQMRFYYAVGRGYRYALAPGPVVQLVD